MLLAGDNITFWEHAEDNKSVSKLWLSKVKLEKCYKIKFRDFSLKSFSHREFYNWRVNLFEIIFNLGICWFWGDTSKKIILNDETSWRKPVDYTCHSSFLSCHQCLGWYFSLHLTIVHFELGLAYCKNTLNALHTSHLLVCCIIFDPV